MDIKFEFFETRDLVDDILIGEDVEKKTREMMGGREERNRDEM